MIIIISIHSLLSFHSMTLATTPAPTVFPPSLKANRRPSAMARGLINSISNVALSPGTTISTPSGSLQVPVTSAVLKKNCGLWY